MKRLKLAQRWQASANASNSFQTIALDQIQYFVYATETLFIKKESWEWRTFVNDFDSVVW